MNIKQSVFLFVLALALATGLTQPVAARSDITEKDNDGRRVEEVVHDIKAEVVTELKVGEDAKTRAQRQVQRISEQRVAIKERIEQRKTAVKQRLAGKRLAVCENRETRINQLLTRSAQNGQRQLGTIQRLEEGVKTFYSDRQLSAEGFEAAATVVDTKEADAIAALEVLKNLEYDCATVDAERPAEVVSSLVHDRHEALKSYRTAVKDMLLVVKQALETRAAQEKVEA